MNGPIITCTPQEIQDLRIYVRTLETQLHNFDRELAGFRAARSVRLAKAVRGLTTQPRIAIQELVSALRRSRPLDSAEKAAHRHFNLFARAPKSMPLVPPEARAFTLMPEILKHCGTPTIVVLRGAVPRACVHRISMISVTPHDFEVALAPLTRPLLLIDPDAISTDSSWYGIMSFEDMRLNQSFSHLLDLVTRMNGHSFITRTESLSRFPLMDDFATAASIVDGFGDLDALIAKVVS